jgi:hypothetical protein
MIVPSVWHSGHGTAMPLDHRNEFNSTYNQNMARGWESKSVEEQMAASQQEPLLLGSADQRKLQLNKSHHARQLQSLYLQRENILSQRTSNPGRRAALEAALAHVEQQIAALG